MKTLKTFIILLFISVIGFAQNGINYKALIKDANGNVIANTAIQIQFTIIEDITDVYTEIHAPTTDANGIIIVNIGEGAATFGDFNTINWSIRTHFLNVQIDTGSGFVDLGTTQFMSVPYAKYAETAANASNVSGLEAIDEGNGMGWRLVGANPNFYGDIGNFAIDLSFNDENNNLYGAVGGVSTAFGRSTTASGIGSTAMGGHTTASGLFSTSMGHFTNAEAAYSTAIGRYNVGGGNPNSWVETDPLFEVGNGTNEVNTRNALTILKNGQHIINSQNTGLFIPNSINAIRISDSQSNSISITNSGFRGIYINDTAADGIVISNAQQNGIVVSADGSGAVISGNDVGVYASGGPLQSDVPDLILGSSNTSGFSDDGIISTNPVRPSSDMFLRSYDDVVVRLDFDDNETGAFRIVNGFGATVFSVNESGNVDMGIILEVGNETIEDTGSNQLSVDASLIPNTDNAFRLGNSSNRWIGVWATDGTINTSDRREKKNIKNLNYGLKEVLQMQPVSFNWKNKNNPDTKLGLIAQDVLKIVPEVVKTHIWEKNEISGVLTKKELDRLGVYYSDLVPVLIKAIQEQQEIIDNQNIKIEGLISELTELKSMNSRIKALEVLLNTKSKDVKVVSIHQ